MPQSICTLKREMESRRKLGYSTTLLYRASSIFFWLFFQTDLFCFSDSQITDKMIFKVVRREKRRKWDQNLRPLPDSFITENKMKWLIFCPSLFLQTLPWLSPPGSSLIPHPHMHVVQTSTSLVFNVYQSFIIIPPSFHFPPAEGLLSLLGWRQRAGCDTGMEGKEW